MGHGTAPTIWIRQFLVIRRQNIQTNPIGWLAKWSLSLIGWPVGNWLGYCFAHLPEVD